MRTLIQQIRSSYPDEDPQERPIFINGYDRPVPDGRGFQTHTHITVTGPWLRPVLNAARVNPQMDFRIEVMSSLLGRLNSIFQQLDNRNNGVTFIHSLGTLSTGGNYRDDWANEIHPTSSGFDKIVDTHWIPQMAPWNLTA